MKANCKAPAAISNMDCSILLHQTEQMNSKCRNREMPKTRKNYAHFDACFSEFRHFDLSYLADNQAKVALIDEFPSRRGAGVGDIALRRRENQLKWRVCDFCHGLSENDRKM